MLRDQLQVSCEIKRLSRTGDKIDFVTHNTIKAHKQPLTEAYRESFEGDFSKGYVLYADVDSGVKNSDEIVIDSVSYFVRGVKTWDALSIKHLEILIEEKNE